MGGQGNRMLTFAAEADIPAPVTHVWRTLLDVDAWPLWDTSLDRVEGRLEPGGRVTVHVKEGARPFRLRVVDLVPNRLIVLRGDMPLGLFNGTRRYRLDQLGQERTSFAMEETYAGLLAPAITRSIPNLQPGFDAFAAGLSRASAA
jgi:uncharacterized protein YndB with AHSA1/START domain